MLGEGILLFNFQEHSDVEGVLKRGLRRFKEKLLHLDKWALEIRCF